MKTKAGTLLMIGVFSFLILNTGTGQTRAEQTPSPSTAIIGEGWLSWSPEQRVIFVEGYLIGYEHGLSNACHSAYNLFELDKPHDINETVYDRCYRKTESYSKGSDVYAKVITEFYTKHVRYGNIPTLYLMTLLIDGRYQTADELYQAAVKREIQVDFTWKKKEPQ